MYTGSSEAEKSISVRDVSGTTSGRLVSMCGQIGVITKASMPGWMMGPPAASE